jgi:CheY-like chemotaxis protein/HPt (histidine-containing phosphotransfer) domain-containing protein
MTRIRLLHVDDEPDIREIVGIALSLDPAFELRSCESGSEALAVAGFWNPDIVLLDVMMPVMDGPATLTRLRENPRTAGVPVIFMTARAQSREVDRFRALGAIGVIAKPFDPMALAASVRHYLPPVADPLDELRAGFLQRVSRDIAALSQDHAALTTGVALPHTLDWIKQTAHSLSGAGGIYGFAEISDAAAALEDAAIAGMAGTGSDAMLAGALDELIRCAGTGEHRRGELVEAATR